MFAHSYSLKTVTERAKQESYALAKSSVSSRRRYAATDNWPSRSDAGSEFHVAGPATAKLRGPYSRLFLWLGRRGHRVQLIVGIRALRSQKWQRPFTAHSLYTNRIQCHCQCIPVLGQHLYNLSNSFKLGVWYMTESCTEKQHFTFLYSLPPQWVELPPPADPTDQGAKCAALIFFSGGGPPVSMPQIFGTSYAHTQCEKKTTTFRMVI